MSEKEKIVFEQELSTEELNNVSGGGGQKTYENDPCTYDNRRNIRRDGFPNCAATVESGSWCDKNDACYMDAVVYYDMKDCSKAWE